jgi:hypothetical protein
MLLHNASSYHALPALLSALHQTLGALEVARTGNESAAAPVLVARSHPLPLTSEESVQLDSLLTVSSRLLSCLFAAHAYYYGKPRFSILY